MADLISRLKLESGEFESKIARATKGLLTMEKECREVGGTLAILDKEQLEFVKGLGQMETVTQNAKGKVAELTAAYTELSVQYNRLTKEEKHGDYGRALASSLEQLKRRIKDSKSELAGVEGSLNGVGDAFKQLGNKIGIPMDMFTKFGPAIAVAGAALKVAKDTFKQNEEIMDEWGRTMESASSMYKGFLNALNTGDIGGFLRNIGNIISKAREAYDAMDELGTFNAFNQIQIESARTNFTESMANYREGSGSKEDVKAAAEKLKAEMQSRQDKEQAAYIAAINDLAATRGVDAEMLKKALGGTYGDYETLKATPLTRHEEQIWNGNMYGNTTTTKVTWSADTMEQKLGEALRKLNDDELAHIQSLGAQAQRTATEIAQIDKQTVRVLGAGNKGDKMQVEVEPVLPEGSAAALRKQISDLQKQWDLATTQGDRDSLDGQIKAAEEALKAMTPQIAPVAAAIKDAAAMWTEHSEKLADVKARLAEFQAMVTDTSLTDAQREWAAGMAASYQQQLDKMTGATEEAANNISKSLDKIPTKFELIQKSLDKMSTGVGAISTLGNSFNELKSIGDDLAAAFSGEMDSWDALMTVFNSGIGIMETVISVMEAINTLQALSSTLSDQKKEKQLEETTAVVTGKMAESTANVQEAGTSMLSAGANTAESSTAAGKAVANIPIVGPILAVAAIAAVLGAAIGAMSKAKSAGHFSGGGMIMGNSYSGDNLTANVNSGELILNRAQQGSIAGQLQNNPLGNLQLTSKVRGSDLLIVLDNTNSSRGGQRGMYVNVR